MTFKKGRYRCDIVLGFLFRSYLSANCATNSAILASFSAIAASLSAIVASLSASSSFSNLFYLVQVYHRECEFVTIQEMVFHI